MHCTVNEYLLCCVSIFVVYIICCKYSELQVGCILHYFVYCLRFYLSENNCHCKKKFKSCVMRMPIVCLSINAKSDMSGG